MPTLGRVQWTGDDPVWRRSAPFMPTANVAFREINGTVPFETPDGRRVAAKVGDWIVRRIDGFHIDAV